VPLTFVESKCIKPCVQMMLMSASQTDGCNAYSLGFYRSIAIRVIISVFTYRLFKLVVLLCEIHNEKTALHSSNR